MSASIGILGGMGPLATCDLMQKIINATDAKRDQDHIHIYVDCNTNIPDRTDAILYSGISPIPELVKSAVRLQSLGANVLVMPCNTAHFYWKDICKFIDIPLLHMPFETAAYLSNKSFHKVAVLATDGTVKSRIYDNALNEAGIQSIYPTPKEQNAIMSLIYDCVKGGLPYPPQELMLKMTIRLQNAGAEALILACTELPIAFNRYNLQIPTIDPTTVLAQAAIKAVGAPLRTT